MLKPPLLRENPDSSRVVGDRATLGFAISLMTARRASRRPDGFLVFFLPTVATI